MYTLLDAQGPNLPESYVQTKDQIPQGFTLFLTITDTSAFDSERNHSVD